uniref:Uncharacterized protein n=1 Tax=Cynoglossus semilaevis TaxID=244447 RepID=A0A3P8W546_CYNSE
PWVPVTLTILFVVCYVLDGILFVYGVVLTALYCKVTVCVLWTHTRTIKEKDNDGTSKKVQISAQRLSLTYSHTVLFKPTKFGIIPKEIKLFHSKAISDYFVFFSLTLVFILYFVQL